MVTEDHAKLLLAGKILHVEAEATRVWPMFSLYKEGRAMLMEKIEEAIRDKEAVVARVRERKDLEYQMLLANRIEMIEEEEDEEEKEEGGDRGGEGGGDNEEEEEEEEEEAMTPEEVRASESRITSSISTLTLGALTLLHTGTSTEL